MGGEGVVKGCGSFVLPGSALSTLPTGPQPLTASLSSVELHREKVILSSNLPFNDKSSQGKSIPGEVGTIPHSHLYKKTEPVFEI